MIFRRSGGLAVGASVLLTICTPFFGADIPTAQYDAARTSWNSSEIYLSATNVNSTLFGKLFSRTVDGWVYAQPLYMQALPIAGHGTPNVVFVCTANNSVYAFDADDPLAAAPYWKANLGAPDNTPSSSISPNSEPNLGIISTPVIVRASNVLYVVAATRESGHRVYRLHALDLTSGQEMRKSPVIISGRIASTAADSSSGILTFNPDFHLQRSSLAVAGNSVLLAMAGSRDIQPFHGWIFGYDLKNLSQTAVLNAVPNGMGGGIWQSTRAPVVDAGGNLYYETGNGNYDGISNFGNSVIRISSGPHGFSVSDWFTPDNWQSLTDNDLDLSSAGPLLAPGTTSIFAAGKNGTIYVLNTQSLGGLKPGNTQIRQVLQVSPACSASSCDFANDMIFWNNASAPALYIWPLGDVLRAYSWTGGTLAPVASSMNTLPSSYPGGFLAGSSYGSVAGTGIVWALTGDNQTVQAATLRAFDASNVANQLWTSALNAARDGAGNFAKNVLPVVANGKVYVGNFSGQLNVYGLLNGPVYGDVNADGKVDCADVAIVKASYNLKSTDSGFDARADVVHDNVIDMKDLTAVSQQLAGGASCP